MILVDVGPLKRPKLARTTARLQQPREQVSDAGIGRVEGALFLAVFEATCSRLAGLDMNDGIAQRRAERMRVA